MARWRASDHLEISFSISSPKRDRTVPAIAKVNSLTFSRSKASFLREYALTTSASQGIGGRYFATSRKSLNERTNSGNILFNKTHVLTYVRSSRKSAFRRSTPAADIGSYSLTIMTSSEIFLFIDK